MVTVLFNFDTNFGDDTEIFGKHHFEIKEYFQTRWFNLPFVPVAGMYIDLSEFIDSGLSYEAAKVIDSCDLIQIEKVVIKKDNVMVFLT